MGGASGDWNSGKVQVQPGLWNKSGFRSQPCHFPDCVSPGEALDLSVPHLENETPHGDLEQHCHEDPSVPREKCLEQQLARTERSGNISWHDYPKEGSGGADPKGHLGLATLPAWPLPPLLRSLGSMRWWPGGSWAWPGRPAGCSGQAELADPAAASVPRPPLRLRSPDPAPAAAPSSARARRLFLLRSADALGRLGCLRAVAAAVPLGGVSGPSILKEQRGDPVASEWDSGGLHAASREAAGPQPAFPLRDEALFFSFHPAQDMAQSCPLTLGRLAVWTGVFQGWRGATWPCGGPD